MNRDRVVAKWALALAFGLALGASGPEGASVRRMRADLEFLCADSLKGRLSLSREADVAAQYIAAAFERAGLEPAAGKSFLQQFPLVAYDPDPARTRLALVRKGQRKEFRNGQEYRGGSWRELTATAAVVFAGYGITAPEYGYDDYAGVDARGKVVLLFDHEPQETDAKSIFNGTGHTRHANSRVKVANAMRHGAVAVLLESDPLRKHAGAFDPAPRASGERSLRANAPRQAIEEDTIPLFPVSDSVATEILEPTGKSPGALAEEIDRSLKPVSQAIPETRMEVATGGANVRRGVSLNAAGFLRGADPALAAETVLLTAHYDHLGIHGGRVYPGANDNASGTVGVMELARMFAAGPRPRRSLLFVVFGSEEEGLLGSYYYVEHPLRPLSTTRAVLNLDMIARDEAHIPQSRGVVDIPDDTRNEINLVGVFYSPDLKAAIAAANGGAGLEISTKFDRDHDLNALFRCDHFPFLLHDVPATWFFGGWHPGYHEPSDTIARLNFAKLEKVVNLAGRTARGLADAEHPPRFQRAR